MWSLPLSASPDILWNLVLRWGLWIKPRVLISLRQPSLCQDTWHIELTINFNFFQICWWHSLLWITLMKACYSSAPALWGQTSSRPASWSSSLIGQHPDPPAGQQPRPQCTWRPPGWPSPSSPRGTERTSFVSKQYDLWQIQGLEVTHWMVIW